MFASGLLVASWVWVRGCGSADWRRVSGLGLVIACDLVVRTCVAMLDGGWCGYCGFCAVAREDCLFCVSIDCGLIVLMVVGILLVWVFYCEFGCELHWWFSVFSAGFTSVVGLVCRLVCLWCFWFVCFQNVGGCLCVCFRICICGV